MKNYIHARLNEEDRKILNELKRKKKTTESTLVRQGLKLIYQQEIENAKTALELANDLAGKYASGLGDLSYNKKHMGGLGED